MDSGNDESPHDSDVDVNNSDTQSQIVSTGDTIENDRDDKCCHGCGRNSVSVVCYYSANPLAWGLLDMRGGWCRDCFNVWRLL